MAVLFCRMFLLLSWHAVGERRGGWTEQLEGSGRRKQSVVIWSWYLHLCIHNREPATCCHLHIGVGKRHFDVYVILKMPEYLQLIFFFCVKIFRLSNMHISLYSNNSWHIYCFSVARRSIMFENCTNPVVLFWWACSYVYVLLTALMHMRAQMHIYSSRYLSFKTSVCGD